MKNEIIDQNNRLRALREIDLAILSSTDLKIILKTVLREIANQLKIDAADILLLNKQTNTLEYACGYGFRSNLIEKSRLYLGEGIAGKAALE